MSRRNPNPRTGVESGQSHAPTGTLGSRDRLPMSQWPEAGMPTADKAWILHPLQRPSASLSLNLAPD